MQLSIANILNSSMNKTLLQWFLLNCNKIPAHCTCQGWQINQSPLDKQHNSQQWHTSCVSSRYPCHDGCHASVTRRRDMRVRETWCDTALQMKKCTHTVYILCTLRGHWRGSVHVLLTTLLSLSLIKWARLLSDSILSGSEVSGHYDNLEPRLEKSHQRERVITGVMS